MLSNGKNAMCMKIKTQYVSKAEERVAQAANISIATPSVQKGNSREQL